MRARLLLLCLAGFGCKSGSGCSPAAVAVEPPPKAMSSTPQAPQTPPSDERFANRYLLIAAAKETPEEATAAAPAGATMLDSTQFSGLTPCLHIAVVGMFEKKADALAAAKQKKDVFPRHSGKWVPNDPERKALCEKKREEAADATGPRFVLSGGLMQLSGEAPSDEAELSKDTSGEVKRGDAFDVYDPDGALTAQGCKVTGFTWQWSGSTGYADPEHAECGVKLALAQLDCTAGGRGHFALRAAAKPPVAWAPLRADDKAVNRVVGSAAYKTARAKLKGGATAELEYTEELSADAWDGPAGTVTMVRWKAQTGNGGICGDEGSGDELSEAVFWPKRGAPRVILPLSQRETELIGVADLSGDGVPELTWSSGSEVWMTSGESSAPLMTESHPFCGCGC